jgi:type II secretory pathway component HofQ
VSSPADSLAFMLLGSDYIVDLELSAAQAEGRGEIVSSPRVITANQREATIEQGVEIPYQQSAGGASGGTTISFKKAVLSLTVKPLITRTTTSSWTSRSPRTASASTCRARPAAWCRASTPARSLRRCW